MKGNNFRAPVHTSPMFYSKRGWVKGIFEKGPSAFPSPRASGFIPCFLGVFFFSRATVICSLRTRNNYESTPVCLHLGFGNHNAGGVAILASQSSFQCLPTFRKWAILTGHTLSRSCSCSHKCNITSNKTVGMPWNRSIKELVSSQIIMSRRIKARPSEMKG